jgi:hypothetical protein
MEQDESTEDVNASMDNDKAAVLIVYVWDDGGVEAVRVEPEQSFTTAILTSREAVSPLVSSVPVNVTV